MWLQGGPGCSSMTGLFIENGPYHIDPSTLRLVDNHFTWNKEYSMLYVDNPVGSGFSYVERQDGYVTNELQVANYMQLFLTRFFKQVHPEQSQNEFYIFGESYAGKYIPSIAHRLFFAQPSDVIKVNIKGVGIGDGLTHPIQQFTDYAEFGFNTGLLDQKQYRDMVSVQNVAKTLIEQQKWSQAMNHCNQILNSFVSESGGINVYDIRDYGEYDMDYMSEYVMQPDVRVQMHTNGKRDYHDCDSETYAKLQNDMPQSVRQYVIDLLNNGFPMMLYNGQFDMIINTPAAERWIYDMPWDGQSKYQSAKRNIWKNAHGDVVGYTRTSGPLTQVVVNKAGHLSPMDQPENTLDMVTKFITKQTPFVSQE